MKNLTFEESLETFNSFLEEMGEAHLSESEVRDFGIQGGETNAQLEEWARDFVSEIQTEKCAEKDAWRYEL